jgi:hypothetical protein
MSTFNKALQRKTNDYIMQRGLGHRSAHSLARIHLLWEIFTQQEWVRISKEPAIGAQELRDKTLASAPELLRDRIAAQLDDVGIWDYTVEFRTPDEWLDEYTERQVIGDLYANTAAEMMRIGIIAATSQQNLEKHTDFSPEQFAELLLNQKGVAA